jgi:hypothetical protein
MKKQLVILISAIFLVSGLPVNAAIIAGAVCKTPGQVKVSGGKEFSCIKKGSKFVWNKGVTIAKSATPTSAPSISPKPSTQPTTSPSKSVPLLRTSDFTFVSGNLKVAWSGLDSSQQQLTNVRRINVWVFDLQSEQSLAGGVWRVACLIAPTPGEFCEISLPPRDHAIRITASFLNGEQSSWSTTLRAKASPVVSIPPALMSQLDNGSRLGL